MSDSVWRLLDLGVVEPYESHIMVEVLLIAKKRKLIPNTLLIRVPKRHVEIGHKANLKRVDVEYCHVEGIPIVRVGVGRTVSIYDEDTLICDMVSDLVIQGVSLNYESFMNGIVKGLQFMALEAYIRPKSNDVLIGNKKISGGGHFITHDVFFAGGSVIMDFNYELCENAIMPNPELFANKEAKSHREWVTTLNAELGREVSYSEVVSALKKGFEEVLHVEFDVSTSLTESEDQILNALSVKYHSDKWLKSGRWSPVKDYGI